MTVNPFNLDGTEQTDVRDTWVGSERAAEEIGVCRTQAWRLGRKWARMQLDSERPPVRVILMGTEQRPEYKYLLGDVVRFARERRFKKAQKQVKLAQRNLRAMLPLLKKHSGLADVFAPLLASMRVQRLSSTRVGGDR